MTLENTHENEPTDVGVGFFWLPHDLGSFMNSGHQKSHDLLKENVEFPETADPEIIQVIGQWEKTKGFSGSHTVVTLDMVRNA